jgi:RNA polymerase sigma-70 factor (ECF subfamily)
MIQAGDDHALVVLYDRYSQLVWSVALRALRNSASAEDVLSAEVVLQDIFIQLLITKSGFKFSGATLFRRVSDDNAFR